MKILRIINNKQIEIELTDNELENAFREQERAYLISEIGEALSYLNEDDEGEQVDEKRILSDDKLCDCIIETYKDTVYSNDMDNWMDAIKDSITKEYYVKSKVIAFTRYHGDYVKCNDCDKTMIVPIGEETCPCCGGKGHLKWADESEDKLTELSYTDFNEKDIEIRFAD